MAAPFEIIQSQKSKGKKNKVDGITISSLYIKVTHPKRVCSGNQKQ
jgi:hypothetical protein